MTTQITGGLYIGDIDDIREGDTREFDLIVGVCQDDCSDNVGCEYEHFNLADGPDQQGHVPGEYSYELLSEAIDAVIAARIRRQTVCVHCHAGRSRSATVVVAAMAVLDGMTWNESFNKARESRPIINPGPTLVEDGKRYIEEHQ
jgi:protein-tyrosine phosphatase